RRAVVGVHGQEVAAHARHRGEPAVHLEDRPHAGPDLDAGRDRGSRLERFRVEEVGVLLDLVPPAGDVGVAQQQEEGDADHGDEQDGEQPGLRGPGLPVLRHHAQCEDLDQVLVDDQRGDHAVRDGEEVESLDSLAHHAARGMTVPLFSPWGPAGTSLVMIQRPTLATARCAYTESAEPSSRLSGRTTNASSSATTVKSARAPGRIAPRSSIPTTAAGAADIHLATSAGSSPRRRASVHTTDSPNRAEATASIVPSRRAPQSFSRVAASRMGGSGRASVPPASTASETSANRCGAVDAVTGNP